MKVELNADELKLAIADWLEKQMPEVLQSGKATITDLSVAGYPETTVIVSAIFVLTPKKATP
jgi:hypothetical protein